MHACVFDIATGEIKELDWQNNKALSGYAEQYDAIGQIGQNADAKKQLVRNLPKAQRTASPAHENAGFSTDLRAYALDSCIVFKATRSKNACMSSCHGCPTFCECAVLGHRCFCR